jgi:serine/threonine protein kinase
MQVKHSLKNPDTEITYYLTEELGEGYFGKVWGGIDSNKRPVAIKISCIKNNTNLQDWFNEISNQINLNHQNIIKIYDFFITSDTSTGNTISVIVMEKALMSLDKYLQINKSFSPIHVCWIGCKLCDALFEIHKSTVIHRDLTLRNILLFPDYHVKIADFGISKRKPDLYLPIVSNTGFFNAIPPEILKHGYSDFQSDIYQLGLILLTLLTGQEPIPQNLDHETINHLINEGQPRKIAESLIEEFGNLAYIISCMLCRRLEWRYQSILELRVDLDKELGNIQMIEIIQMNQIVKNFDQKFYH